MEQLITSLFKPKRQITRNSHVPASIGERTRLFWSVRDTEPASSGVLPLTPTARLTLATELGRASGLAG